VRLPRYSGRLVWELSKAHSLSSADNVLSHSTLPTGFTCRRSRWLTAYSVQTVDTVESKETRSMPSHPAPEKLSCSVPGNRQFGRVM